MTQIEIEVVRSGDIDDLRARLGDSQGMERALSRFADSTARVVQSFAELNAPKDSRRLVDQISRDDSERQASGAVQARVGVGSVSTLSGGRQGPLNDKQGDYPYFVHEGTGLYGKLHQMIRPRRAKAMRFYGKTGLVVTPTVRGQRPQPYLGAAYSEVQEVIPYQLGGLVDDILDGRV